MSDITFTDAERRYLDCSEPMLTKAQAAKGISAGLVTGLLQAAFTPGNTKGDRRLISVSRRMRYTRYKKAVMRKQNGTPKKHDEKLLKKLNKQPFALEAEADDADAFTRRLYEEYMEKHTADQ